MSTKHFDFEASLEEIKKCIHTLEKGEGALDDLLSSYERGLSLYQECVKYVEGFESKIKEKEKEILWSEDSHLEDNDENIGL